MTEHTASDFAPAGQLTAHDRGYLHAQRAAQLAVDCHYLEAIAEYAIAISAFEESIERTAAERIAFAEAEIARFEVILRGGQ